MSKYRMEAAEDSSESRSIKNAVLSAVRSAASTVCLPLNLRPFNTHRASTNDSEAAENHWKPSNHGRSDSSVSSGSSGYGSSASCSSGRFSLTLFEGEDHKKYFAPVELGCRLSDLSYDHIRHIVDKCHAIKDVMRLLSTCKRLSRLIPLVLKDRFLREYGMSCETGVWGHYSPQECYKTVYPFLQFKNQFFTSQSNCYGALIQCLFSEHGVMFEEALPPPDDSYLLLKTLTNQIVDPFDGPDENSIYEARLFNLFVIRPGMAMVNSRSGNSSCTYFHFKTADQKLSSSKRTGNVTTTKNGVLSVNFSDCKYTISNLSEILWSREFGKEIRMDKLTRLTLQRCFMSRSLKHRFSCVNTTNYVVRRLSIPRLPPDQECDELLKKLIKSLVKSGIYTGPYSVCHGQEFVMIRYDTKNHNSEVGKFLIGQKITGDDNVPAGKITFEINLDSQCSLENLSGGHAIIAEVKSLIQETRESNQQMESFCHKPFNNYFSIYKEKYPTYAYQTRETYIAAFCGYGQVAHSGYIEPEFIPIIAVIFDSDTLGIFWPDLECFLFFYRQRNIIIE